MVANWCFPAVRRLESMGGKAGLCRLFQTLNSKKMKEITFCVDCQKPLYVTENIKLFGFDTRKFCRSNRHFNVEVKIVSAVKLHSA